MNKIEQFKNLYNGASLFLIGSGPSFNREQRKQLAECDIITMGLNNSPKNYRPDLWCAMDPPSWFLPSILLDPKIIKLIPNGYARHAIGSKTIGELPSFVSFPWNNEFNENVYLSQETVNYGCAAGNGGGRSVLLAALKVAFLLGFRRIYLLGIDFKMVEGEKNYHFDQDTSKHAVESNNETFKKLSNRFMKLLPSFSDNDFEVYNCNPDSALRVFPFIDLADAIRKARKDIPDPTTESTVGRYEKGWQKSSMKSKATRKKNRCSLSDLKPIEVKKAIVMTGISRSGNHAVLDWICSQHTGNVEYRNNLIAHYSNRYIHNPSDTAIPKRWYSLPNCERAGNEATNVDTFIYSYENQNAKSFDVFPAVHSGQTIKALLIRDPFNLMASQKAQVDRGNKFWFYKTCTDDGVVNPSKLHKFYTMWMSHYELSKNKDIVTILYNKWATSLEYRNLIAEKIGVDSRCDLSMNDVPSNGGGSSFDGCLLDGSATKMNVMERWKTCSDYRWYRDFFRVNTDLVEASNELFGELEVDLSFKGDSESTIPSCFIDKDLNKL